MNYNVTNNVTRNYNVTNNVTRNYDVTNNVTRIYNVTSKVLNDSITARRTRQEKKLFNLCNGPTDVTKLPSPSPPPSSTLNQITATPSFSISTPPKHNVCSLSKTHLDGLLPERPGIIISFLYILKSLHWLKIPDRIHFKVLSLTYNSLAVVFPARVPSRTLHHPANPLYFDHHSVSPFLDPR